MSKKIDVSNLSAKAIVNVTLYINIINPTRCFLLLNGGFRVCLRNTAANRGQCVTKYQARVRPVFIGGGES